MAAAGRAVSPSNLRGPKTRPVRAVRSPSIPKPLRSPQALDAIERLRTRVGASGRTLSQENLATNLEVSRNRDKAERELENTALRSMPTRGEALKAEDQVRANTRLNAEGTRVELLRGARQVGTERVGAVQRAAERGQLRREGNRFTTPRVRRTRKKVKRARRELRKARAATRTPRKNLMAAGLDAEQAKVLATVLNVGRKMGATKKEMLSAVETALVESNIRNLDYGDRDSLGWRQERQMYYPNPTNVKDSARRYFEETAAEGRGVGMTAGQLAQAAQQSAFPEKYDERKADAVPLLRAFSSAGSASPKAKRRLERAKAKAETIDEEAARLGLPGTKGLSAEGKRDLEENYTIRKEKGDWAGSQALIQKILGVGSNLASDKEARGTGSYHDTGNLTAYAQDIPISGGLEEGEPVYDQALLDRVTKRIRRMGGEVPDLVMGMGYTTGYLQGYTLEIIPDSTSNWHGTGPHLHIGAQWTGEKPPPGTQLGGGSNTATGSVGPSGTTFPSASPNAPGGPASRSRRQSVRALLRELGYQMTPTGGIRRIGAADTEIAAPDATDLKEKYGLT